MVSITPQPGDDLQSVQGPWWVPAILRLGIPAVLVLAFSWFLMHSVASDLSTLKGDTAEIRKDIGLAITGLQIHVSSTDHHLEHVTRILQVQCVNAAKSTGERTACLETDR